MPTNVQNAKQKQIALADLQIPASGYFHHLEDALTDQEVSVAFNSILSSSNATQTSRLLRESRVANGTNCWASLLVHSTNHKPSFLPNSQLEESVYGFTLLVEAQVAGAWIIGIFKKGAAGVDEALESILKSPKRGAFARAFSKGATFQRLSLKRMTASKHELQASSYEAFDLKTALPTFGITRSVPRSLRIRHDTHGSISITPGTFRLQRSGGRCGIDEIAELVILVGEEIARSNPNEFLDVLPQEVDFSQKPKSLRPTGVLIELGPLLEATDIEVWRTNKNGVEHKIRPQLLLKVLGGVLEATKNGPDWNLRNDDGDVVGTLKETATGYGLRQILSPSLVVKSTSHDGETKRASTWLNRNDALRIVFSRSDYFYTGGQLYHRTGFSADIAIVANAITDCPELNAATSEKGKPGATATKFSAKSIFRITEDSLLNDCEYLWCSDLGDEWADYIGLDANRVIFAHCKHGEKTKLGATGYQEVLGQAMKNLGNVKSTPEEFGKKIKAAANTRTWGNTNIQRLRTPNKTWAAFEADLIQRIETPNFRREVHLVVTMLSKAEFDAEAAKPRKKPSFTQLIWLLASFINSCRELGAHPQIYCKP